MAGTGKSTISRTLAGIFQAQNILGGTFFFSRSSGEANNASNFVGTLAHCLASVSAPLKRSICNVIDSDSDVLRQGLRNQWKELIVTPLKNMNPGHPVTFNSVVDALDECRSDNDTRILISLFVELQEITHVNVGIFVTSRPEVVIRLGFKQVPAIIHQQLDLREIPRETVEHDISVSLEKRLSEIAVEREIANWPEKAAIQALVDKADCLFIYAATACRFIASSNWDPAERLFKLIRSHSLGDRELTLLAEMYTQVLDSALTTGYDAIESSELCNRFKEVVGTIVVLYDELPVFSIAKLLSRSINWVDGCLASLHSVLNVPKDLTSPVRLLHPSFRDFVLSRPDEAGKRFFPIEAHVHTVIFTKCLDILATSLSRNIGSLPTPGSPPQEPQRRELDSKIFKHLRYACRYWVDHFRCAVKARNEGDQLESWQDEQICNFFQKNFLNWLEAMSLLDRMTTAMVMINQLWKMIQVSEHH